MLKTSKLRLGLLPLSKPRLVVVGSQSFCGGATESPTNGVLMTFFEEEENGGFVEEEQVEDDETQIHLLLPPQEISLL